LVVNTKVDLVRDVEVIEEPARAAAALDPVRGPHPDRADRTRVGH